jgi:hypothetical protein
MTRNVVLITLFVLLVLCLIGGAIVAGTIRGHPPVMGPPSPSIGDTFNDIGIDCTLVAVQIAPKNMRPIEGQEIIVLTVRITNQIQEESSFRYYPSDFSIAAIQKTGLAPNGTNLTSQTLYASQITEVLGSGTLTSGKTITGNLIFAIPKESQQATLYWRPLSLYRSKTGIWNFAV